MRQDFSHETGLSPCLRMGMGLAAILVPNLMIKG